MQICVDLKNLDAHQDYLQREEKAVSILIQEIRVQYDYARETSPENVTLLLQQLHYAERERERILLRRKFLKNMTEELKTAIFALDRVVEDVRKDIK